MHNYCWLVTPPICRDIFYSVVALLEVYGADMLMFPCPLRMALGRCSARALWGSCGTSWGVAVNSSWRSFRATARLSPATPIWNELLHWIIWTRPVTTRSRLEGAVTSGRAAASAPALWTFTQGTKLLHTELLLSVRSTRHQLQHYHRHHDSCCVKIIRPKDLFTQKDCNMWSVHLCFYFLNNSSAQMFRSAS